MSATASKEIMRRIQRGGAGSVFTGSDFAAAAPRATVDQTLSRLTRAGRIRRLARGLYDYPRTHEKLGTLAPAPDDIAQAIARRDNIRVQPSGEAAANALGLSTQVPAKLVYLTDGPSRTLRVGKYTIQFQHRSPGRLTDAGGAVTLAVNALQYVGPDEARRPEVKRAISRSLKDEEKRRLAASARRLPAWMQTVVRDIAMGGSE